MGQSKSAGAGTDDGASARATELFTRALRPFGLALFILAGALSVATVFYFHDAAWTPLWLLLAAYGLSLFAEGGRSGAPADEV